MHHAESRGSIEELGQPNGHDKITFSHIAIVDHMEQEMSWYSYMRGVALRTTFYSDDVLQEMSCSTHCRQTSPSKQTHQNDAA